MGRCQGEAIVTSCDSTAASASLFEEFRMRIVYIRHLAGSVLRRGETKSYPSIKTWLRKSLHSPAGIAEATLMEYTSDR
jgi:hypothetical protein